MYRCEACGQLSEPGEPMELAVVEQRHKVYYNEGRVSRGWEIVREERRHPQCALLGLTILRPPVEVAP